MLPLKDNIPSKTFPFITILLVLINAAVFFYQLSLGPEEQRRLLAGAGAVPWRILSEGGISAYLTLTTSLFLHGGFIHLAGNMLFLWIFGDNVEDRMGRFRFSVFYLFCGAAAAMAHVWHNPQSTTPLIGASGAVSGVLGAYMLLFPKARIQVLVVLLFFITTIKVPAFLFIGAWAGLQVLNVSRGHPQVAWFAHIGGFAAGAAITGAGWLGGSRRG